MESSSASYRIAHPAALLGLLLTIAPTAFAAPASPPTCPLDIATEPAGASVLIDGRPVGQAPLSGASLPSGTHRINIRAPGWADVEDSARCDSLPVTRRYSLARSRAWIDSVERRRADSLAAARKAVPAARARAALGTPAPDLSALMSQVLGDSALPSPLSEGGAATVAVLPFTSLGAVPPEAARLASEYAVLRLSGDRRFRLVERERFQSILQEQALSGSGLVAPGRELELGQVLEARLLLLGTIASEGQRRVVAMRLVDAQDGAVVSAGAARVEGPTMDEAVRDALGERLDVSGAVYRSLVAPGWGQFWARRPVRGSLWLAATAGLAGTFAWSLWDWADKDDLAEDFRNRDASTFQPGESTTEWLLRANAAVADKNDAADRNVMVGASLAAVWALNVADAAWIGWGESRRTRERYFAVLPLGDGAALRMAMDF